MVKSFVEVSFKLAIFKISDQEVHTTVSGFGSDCKSAENFAVSKILENCVDKLGIAYNNYTVTSRYVTDWKSIRAQGYNVVVIIKFE